MHVGGDVKLTEGQLFEVGFFNILAASNSYFNYQLKSIDFFFLLMKKSS